MKKITKKDLASLRIEFAPLNKTEMQRFIGGNGEYMDDGVSWISWEDYCNYQGTWTGGWVYGLGYVGPEITIYGNNNGSYSGYGSNIVVYSMNDFDNWEGTWYGGFVYGLGYVGPEATIYSSSGYNLNRMISTLTLQANTYSTSKCATNVRIALEAGGMKVQGDHRYASDYMKCLPQMGFYEIYGKGNYVPKAGDIVVHAPTDGHEYGHIAMYDGHAWISDFVQKDIYGGSAYRKSDNYKVFRFNY